MITKAGLIFFLLCSPLAFGASPLDRLLNFNHSIDQTFHPSKVSCTQHDDPKTESDSINLEPVKSCLASPSIIEGQWKKVSISSRHVCKKQPWWWPNKVQGSKVAYQIRKKDGNVEVALNLQFRYKGSAENKDETILRLNRAVECIQNFFGKQGILLRIGITLSSTHADRKQNDRMINFYDRYTLNNDENWGLKETTGIQLTEDQACGNAAHEVGHMLGLQDEYADPDCPDRPIGPDDSLMTSAGWAGTHAVKLYPKQIAEIIRPLCGEF